MTFGHSKDLAFIEDITMFWGGVLSALDGVSPEDLRCESLIKRASNPDVSEVILAMDATIDGQTTAHYLSEALSESIV